MLVGLFITSVLDNGVSIVTLLEKEIVGAQYIRDLGAHAYCRLIKDKAAPKLIFDFERVEFVSLHGLLMFEEVIEQATSCNGDVAICNVREGIMLVLQLTELVQQWKIYPTLQEALEALNKDE